MMWETYPIDERDERVFDFKYINDYGMRGLNRPAIFRQTQLRALFDLYVAKTGGVAQFP
jgi:hypothetical protein